MGDFDPAFIHSLAVQSWSHYAVGMILICLRLYARAHRLGIKGLQTDDYLMILAGGLYTMLIVCLNVISANGGSNLYEPEDFPTFSPENIQQRIKGSKIVLVSEQAMLNVIYTIKACMLIMYTRLTLGLQVQRMVTYLSIYVAVGWVATEIAFFTACRPFKGYWAMPPPNPQCTTLEHYAEVQGTFNISSDLLMLFIPLPLITKLNVPLKHKSVLFIIFSMGIFVILAALLTKIFNLTDVWDPSYMLWYTRESSVAVYVSNIPMIWPLLREWFPLLRNLSPGPTNSHNPRYGLSTGGRRTHGSTFASKRMSVTGITTTIRGKGESTEELGTTSETDIGTISQHRESWEHARPVANPEDAPFGLNDWREDKGIHMTTTVHVSTMSMSDEAALDAKLRIQSLKNGRRGLRQESERDLERGGGSSKREEDFSWIDDGKR